MLVLFAFLPFISTTLGGFAALRMRHHIHPLMAFSAGLVIATALAELLPEGMELIGEEVGSLPGSLAAVLGYLAFTAIDSLVHSQTLEHEHGAHLDEPHHDDVEAYRHPSPVQLLPSAGIVLHSMLDGLAIGLGFHSSPELGLLVGLAVLAHDFADGMNVVTLVFSAGHGARPAFVLLVLDALAPALGVAISSLIAVSSPVLGVLLCAFAGVFLSIGATHLLPEAQHMRPGVAPGLVLCAAVGASIALFARYLVG
jgi:zinc transporter, ZIP family